MPLYGLNEDDRTIFQETANLRRRPNKSNQYKRRRTAPPGSQGTTASPADPESIILFIDHNILAAVPDDPPSVYTAATEYEYEYPEGDSLQELPLWGYERRLIYLKYYRYCVEGDPGYEVGKQKVILATRSMSDSNDGFVTYDTVRVLFDEFEDFEVGTYDANDYRGYPDTDAFPPDGSGTYRQEREGYFNKKYTAIPVVGKDAQGNKVYILATIQCEEMPPPKLTEVP